MIYEYVIGEGVVLLAPGTSARTINAHPHSREAFSTHGYFTTKGWKQLSNLSLTCRQPHEETCLLAFKFRIFRFGCADRTELFLRNLSDVQKDAITTVVTFDKLFRKRGSGSNDCAMKRFDGLRGLRTVIFIDEKGSAEEKLLEAYSKKRNLRFITKETKDVGNFEWVFKDRLYWNVYYDWKPQKDSREGEIEQEDAEEEDTGQDD
ncbi:hypothetical protein NX059_003824 [Plenodomus lindquistii]|nr:hypothetical protein NX059_003824 [Plenodomus lindquistii]